ncbi:helix-turn-helix domain-containing protein [Streptomyces lydicus]|uniref:helix-turn-helix domain-containing protein n=1 Tax=Streptomyces lydicus TaxID=47763 RepID=UPI001011FD41|nr:helix-turn-helix transcriptional regulator [Streptomyces lydicus]MCZ1006881.1 helix-turn-helix transcriptional regulator [Streptomyces lydicus]
MSSNSNPIRLARTPGPDWTKTAANVFLGHTVREMRENAGLTQKQLAKEILVSSPTVHRLEAAETTPVRRTVDSVINYFKPGASMRDTLTMLLSRALEPEWFQHRFGDCTPGYLRRLLGLESMAITITTYDVRLVPGLLQTSAYAEHIVRTGLHLSEWDGPELELRLAQRAERQERVLGQAAPPQCIFMLDQSVLGRKAGTKKTMHEQMVFLREMADLPHITIRFVLSGRMIAGNAAAMAGSMAQLQFGRGGLPDFVYAEQYEKADYFSKPSRKAKDRNRPLTPRQNDYERHLQLLLRIQGEGCASPAKSRRMLDKAIKRYS